MKLALVLLVAVLAGCGAGPSTFDPSLNPIRRIDSGVPNLPADSGAEEPADASTPPDGGSNFAPDSGSGLAPDSGSGLAPDSGSSFVPDAGTGGGPQDAGLPPGPELNDGWIGGACLNTGDCTNPSPSCLTSGFPGGMCTQACALGSGGTYVCPDTAAGASTGNTLSRCIDAAGSPSCASECDFTLAPTGCRPGYTCVLRERYNQPTKIFPVCLPSASQRWPGEAEPPNDVGQGCASDAACAHNKCLALPGGYCTKTMCEFSGCPAGTECFSLGTTGLSGCLQHCTSDGACRQGEGYLCDTEQVCWPGSQDPTWDFSVGATDCAQAWGTAGNGLSPCDLTKDHYIVVRKSARNMAVCTAGSVVNNFRVGLSSFAPTGDKVQEGDGKTPEGTFYAAQRLPNSSYYKAFLLSYPDKGDADRGRSAGLITQAESDAIYLAQNNCAVPPQTTQLGSYLEVHGRGGSQDWTLGCVAVEDSQIDILWNHLGLRDTIVIKP